MNSVITITKIGESPNLARRRFPGPVCSLTRSDSISMYGSDTLLYGLWKKSRLVNQTRSSYLSNKKAFLHYIQDRLLKSRRAHDSELDLSHELQNHSYTHNEQNDCEEPSQMFSRDLFGNVCPKLGSENHPEGEENRVAHVDVTY